ncbi:MAG TPA: hypothetical protein VKU92_13390 [Acidimicrobiales bacterium]|nr:hypothetical protein [Acidimicrobiales bacterium]
MAIGPRGGAGYWLVGSNGAVYNFGSATKLRSVSHPKTAVVGIPAD